MLSFVLLSDLCKGWFLFIKYKIQSFLAPKPPSSSNSSKIRTWGSPDNESESKRNRRNRSKSVGSNAVERSKKHWVGRPITREAAPKRAMNESLDRYRVIKSKTIPPTAEDYQTADGIPFPAKTGKIFYYCFKSSGTMV